MVPVAGQGAGLQGLGGSRVGLQGARGSRGHLWDPFVPSGWFDETSDDP